MLALLAVSAPTVTETPSKALGPFSGTVTATATDETTTKALDPLAAAVVDILTSFG